MLLTRLLPLLYLLSLSRYINPADDPRRMVRPRPVPSAAMSYGSVS